MFTGSIHNRLGGEVSEIPALTIHDFPVHLAGAFALGRRLASGGVAAEGGPGERAYMAKTSEEIG